jgi:CheY-like chemotaxis protein
MLQRAMDPATEHIPVIALGADAVPRDVAAGLAAGFFDSLTQPMQNDAFGHALELPFQRTHTHSPHATASQSA